MTVNAQRLVYYISEAGFSVPTHVVKRNGTLAVFDVSRIESAISRCLQDAGSATTRTAAEITESVTRAVSVMHAGSTPSVEQIQNAVEVALVSSGEFDAARAYIRYRERHAQERKSRPVPDEIISIFEDDRKYFNTAAQQFTFYDKYSKFNWELGRREIWQETVDRTVDHLRWEVDQHAAGAIDDAIFDRIHDAILHHRVMPSMRLLAMAGPAARRNSMSLYSCSYLPVRDIKTFSEAMLISMAGCGVGFSVEREYVEQFPRIRRQRKNQEVATHYVEDSAEGWADAVQLALETWWDGRDIEFDVSGIRPAGAVLKTKGGRASGPEPLVTMLSFLRSTVLSRQGSFIRTTDAHLMMCAVGEAAVQGGVRRTAMISLFDWDDVDMRNIKNGPNVNPLLWNANNSAVWPEDISDVDIMQQMLDMVKARSGEPGIFSRTNANKTKPKRRKTAKFGTNPCGEILLRPYEFCNLSQAVARKGDTEEDLREKVELATIIGKIQSLSTRFPGLRDDWKKNCEEERLLGVDLTAQVDCELLQTTSVDGADLRSRLLAHAVEVDKLWSEKLEVNESAAISCNKPAGNSAEFLDSSNGIHARHSEYMVRRMTVGANGPLFKVLRHEGVPMEPRVGYTAETATSWIAEFPKKSPDGAVLKTERGAVEQCEFWLMNKTQWTEHNPSCTIDYADSEVVDLIKWVVEHKQQIGGLSFFPKTDAVYAQAPFESISREEYERRVATFPKVDYSLIYRYEIDDMTTSAQELACFAGSCEV